MFICFFLSISMAMGIGVGNGRVDGADIEGTRGEPDFTSDDSTGHGSHVSGSVAGSIYDDWEGPADCPVGDATELETALSCMGKCMEPIELSDAMDNKVLDVDALCPEVSVIIYTINGMCVLYIVLSSHLF